MPYPGQKSIGLPPTVHQEIMDTARDNGISAAKLLTYSIAAWKEVRLNPCRHSPANYEVDPETLDAWCFKCNPPRNLSAERRERDVAKPAANGDNRDGAQ